MEVAFYKHNRGAQAAALKTIYRLGSGAHWTSNIPYESGRNGSTPFWYYVRCGAIYITSLGKAKHYGSVIALESRIGWEGLRTKFQAATSYATPQAALADALADLIPCLDPVAKLVQTVIPANFVEDTFAFDPNPPLTKEPDHVDTRKARRRLVY